MKLLFAGAAALGAIASMNYYLKDGAGDLALQQPVSMAAAASVAFKLHSPGIATSCRVERGDALRDARAPLVFDESCKGHFPMLTEARYWQESGDGNVKFVDGEGKALVEFFASDGVAYESLRPATPLLSLIASQ